MRHGRRVPAETYNRIDNRLYDTAAQSWWKPDSPFHQLGFSFNPVRVGYARRKLLDDLHVAPRGKHLLDVGCGGGSVSEEMARLGFEVTGIDPSGPSLEAATEHARASALAIRYARANGEQLPYRDASFDVVVCFDVLEHVRDLPQVIREIGRALKPGGAFCYDTLNRTWLSYLVAIKIAQDWPRWAFMPPNLHVWEMFIKPREMKSLLRDNRLEWQEHRGMMPDVAVPTLLGYLRRRAAGEWSYGELGEKVHIVESRIEAIMYLGFAVKR